MSHFIGQYSTEDMARARRVEIFETVFIGILSSLAASWIFSRWNRR